MTFIQSTDMYYISTNRNELELYAMVVEKGEQYDGVFTVKWANIIEHKDGGLFAILKHDKYPATMQEQQDLIGWFESELI